MHAFVAAHEVLGCAPSAAATYDHLEAASRRLGILKTGRSLGFCMLYLALCWKDGHSTGVGSSHRRSALAYRYAGKHLRCDSAGAPLTAQTATGERIEDS